MSKRSVDIRTGDARSIPLPNQSVDLVMTSPPYWGLRDYGTPGEIGSEATPSEYVESMLEVLDELARVIKPDGNVIMVIGDKYARTGGVDRKIRGIGADPGGRTHIRPVQRGVTGVPDGSLIGLPYRVALAAIDAGWLWRQDIVWHKPNPLPESVKSRCARSHETVLHLTRSAQHFYTSNVAIGHDVWEYPVQGYRDPMGVRTPAVYPEALAYRSMLRWCPIGGFVLDPFIGSGTTAIAARAHNLEFLGLDISPDMIAVTQRRLARTA